MQRALEGDAISEQGHQQLNNDIQRSVADEIDGWSVDEQGGDFPPLEYAQDTSDTSNTDDVGDDVSGSDASFSDAPIQRRIVSMDASTSDTPNVSRAQAPIQRSPNETVQRDVDSEVQRWADDAPDFDAEPLTPAPRFDAPSDVQDAGDSSASFDTGNDQV